MKNIKKWRPIPQNPILENGTRKIIAHGVEFRNVGTTDVEINDFWLLKPFEVKYFGKDNLELVLEDEFRFKFLGTGSKCVQVAKDVLIGFNYDEII